MALHRLTALVPVLALPVLAWCLPLVTLGCKRDSAPAGNSAQGGSTGDRLQANEDPASKASAFGIPVPKGLRILSRFTRAVHLGGRAKPEDLVDYFRSHVLVDHLEVTGTQTIFPRVYRKGDPQKRLYKIEISRANDYTSVVIEDVTPRPPTPGLTEAQRWERAGLNPDGTPKDLNKLK